MESSKEKLKVFLKQHMKPKYIENLLFNKSREKIYHKAYIHASKVLKGVDIHIDHQLNILYENYAVGDPYENF